MYSFGKRSLTNLNTCHKDLRVLGHGLIKFYDFSVIYGIRTLEEQQEFFRQKKSKLDGVKRKSKHQARICSIENAGLNPDGSPMQDAEGNYIASYAKDICPYKKGTNPFSGKFEDRARFYHMMGMLDLLAKQYLKEGLITHELRFGLDWDSDYTFDDQTFHDLPHVELVVR